MELAKAGQISLEELSRLQFHAFFFADGSNTRLSVLINECHIKASRIIQLKPAESRMLKKRSPSPQSSNPGIEHLELDIHHSRKLTGYLDSIIKTCRNKEIAILFDYSEMPKAWYAGLFEFLLKNDLSCSRLTICFSYLPANCREPAVFSFRKSARPLVNSANLNSGNANKALILGLGSSPEKALSLVRKINPRSIYLFYADPALDAKYTGKILQLNQKLINMAGPSRLISYPLHDMGKTEEIVSALAFDLRLTHRVYLAPLGPKIFTMTCLMLYAKFPDIEVWTTGTAKDLHQHEILLSDPLIIKSVFIREDDCD